ncbi:hypothetical protein CB1_000875030 [Camelus ferus]|nr:hypothetical protein CB1_000875030 [Camelus ferus]
MDVLCLVRGPGWTGEVADTRSVFGSVKVKALSLLDLSTAPLPGPNFCTGQPSLTLRCQCGDVSSKKPCLCPASVSPYASHSYLLGPLQVFISKHPIYMATADMFQKDDYGKLGPTSRFRAEQLLRFGCQFSVFW